MATKDGGHDAGPSPVELFAASVGACMAMIVQRYCESHGFVDGEVSVSLTLELADDPKRIARIVADMELPRDVPADRVEAVRRLAQRCPVHATLHAPPEIDLEVAVARG